MSACSVAAGSGVATGTPAASSASPTLSTSRARIIRRPYVALPPGGRVAEVGGAHGAAPRHSARAYASECTTTSYSISCIQS